MARQGGGSDGQCQWLLPARFLFLPTGTLQHAQLQWPVAPLPSWALLQICRGHGLMVPPRRSLLSQEVAQGLLAVPWVPLGCLWLLRQPPGLGLGSRGTGMRQVCPR